jgi:Ni,Fe-hydrogenase III large subunit
VNQWKKPDGSGLGRAQTARGPLFHRVTLNDDGIQAARWQLLAPTDWHFGSGGPIEAAATTAEALPLLVLSFDPCAPWRIIPEREPAHA